MSDDVDDLHEAEDFAGNAAMVVRQLLEAIAEHRPTILRADLDPLFAAIKNGSYIVQRWDGYCRPTCGANGDPESDECCDDTCGCPCRHVEKREEAAS